MEKERLPAAEVVYHRLKYFLSPQFDLYRNIRAKFKEKLNGHAALDYGCGTGIGTILLLGKDAATNVYGIDCDPYVVDFADKIFGHLAEFSTSDWCAAPLWGSPRLFGLITCIEVVEHVEDPGYLLDNFKRSLVPQAPLVISTLNHNSQYRKNDAHKFGYNVGTFRTPVAKHFAHTKLTDHTLENEIDDDSTIDNLVRPLFMQGSANMSTLLIFFSILGGIQYFGLIGLLYGPLIFGLTMVLLYIYSLEFEAFLNQQDQS